MKIEYHRERLCVLLEQEASDAYKQVDYLRRADNSRCLTRPTEAYFRPVDVECSSQSSSSESSNTILFSVVDRRKIGEWFYGGKKACCKKLILRDSLLPRVGKLEPH